MHHIWKDGQYKRTREIEEVREGFQDQLQRLGTDHVEIGMIHYVDSLADWEAVCSGPVMAYARELKERGIIRGHRPVQPQSGRRPWRRYIQGACGCADVQRQSLLDLQPARGGCGRPSGAKRAMKSPW